MTDERIEKLIEDGWTPYEAQEIVDVEDGKILPEHAELVNISNSEGLSLPSTGNYFRAYTAYVKGDTKNMTRKQRLNNALMKHEHVEHIRKHAYVRDRNEEIIKEHEL